MPFGQIVIGPPGSGKTTYCNSMKEFMEHLGRKVAVINIDPANDVLPYSPEVNISHLIELEDVMNNLHLGPNGALMYCMEYLEKNVDWLLKELSRFEDHYVLMDCPGQV
ncbi:GPN-loop GTPase 2 homolog [Limulus polyphemus]|uniref:GPN-loop GTPase 2 n=1 Tax=Limulus polyphemus TaxID=6850 RepID=A0ABM1C3S4_LIMPO|nr:GPN-loop GTPase 2 homolog [Limulus polyphemus]